MEELNKELLFEIMSPKLYGEDCMSELNALIVKFNEASAEDMIFVDIKSDNCHLIPGFVDFMFKHRKNITFKGKG